MSNQMTRAGSVVTNASTQFDMLPQEANQAVADQMRKIASMLWGFASGRPKASHALVRPLGSMLLVTHVGTVFLLAVDFEPLIHGFFRQLSKPRSIRKRRAAPN